MDEEKLSPTKIKQVNDMPIIESTVGKSEDGKWIIQKTTITSIKPVIWSASGWVATTISISRSQKGRCFERQFKTS